MQSSASKSVWFTSQSFVAVAGFLALLACGESTDRYETCSTGCLTGARCIDDSCQRVVHLQVGVLDSTGGPRDFQSASAQSFAPAPGDPPPDNEALVESGPCALYDLGDLFEPDFVSNCADWGTISASGFPPLDYDCIGDFAVASEDAEGVFEPGSPITVSGSGGADFPAFSVDIEPPSRLVGSISPLERGADIRVTWSPPDSDSPIYVGLLSEPGADRPLQVSCKTQNSESLTIDSSITSYFPETIEGWRGGLARVEYIHLKPEQTDVAIDVVAVTEIVFNL